LAGEGHLQGRMTFMMGHWKRLATPCQAATLVAAAVYATAMAQNQDATPRKHALLVGCTAYPNLDEDLQLTGPANDVALTAALLKARFRFADEQIVTLLHEQRAELRPTAAAIAREFGRLAERTQPGDIVFILLAGHGSQLQNDNPDDATDIERDGLDEVFLPEDVAEWSLAKPAVGAIRDDQLGQWLDAIRANGATVFFVADTCHSGTMDRGVPPANAPVRSRWVDPKLLNPPDVLEDATVETADRAADELDTKGHPAGVADTASRSSKELGPLIALYAVSDDATETEEPMPPYERADGPVYGRLAYALNDVLTRARRPLTYLELAQQLGWRYQGWDWHDVGLLAGSASAFHDEVLGQKSWRDRSTVTLQRGEFGELSLDVGHLHGATVGSIYKVYPPIGSQGDDAAAGCVMVTELTPTTARVEPCAFEEVAEASFDALPAPGRCELAFAAAASLKLAVGVGVAPFDPPSTTADVNRLVALVDELAGQPNSLIQRAADGAVADAFVLLGSQGVYLRRAGDAYGANELPADAFGPFAADGRAGSKVDKALDAMAKAINIRRLAESDASMIIGDPHAPVVELRTTIERRNAATSEFEPVEVARPIDARDGDQLRVTVTNDGAQAVDLTVLYIDSAFSIVSYLPTAYQNATGTANNRLAPGHSTAVTFKITASTLGLEDVILIATLTNPATPMQNFAFLEQPGLDRGGEDNPARATPLGQLLATAAFASGDRGGAAAPDMARYAVHRVSWTVRRTRTSTEPH
jgi:hypothetical protein